MHVHISHPDGEAKSWLSPEVSLAENQGLTSRQLRTVEHFVSVLRPSAEHLYWPALDVDLSVASLRDPSAFPMMARG